MAVSSVSGFSPYLFYSSRTFLPRVGQVTLWPRSGEPSPQGDRPGDRALGPQVRLFDAVGSVLPTQQSFEHLLAFSEREPLYASGSARRYGSALRGLARLEQATDVLQQEIERVVGDNLLNVSRVTPDTTAVKVRATGAPATGLYHLRVLQPARAHRIASDPGLDPLASLGLQGTLYLEGEAIEVVPEDALIDLAVGINRVFEDADEGIRAEVDAEGRLVLGRKQAGPFAIQIGQEGSVATDLGLLQVDEGRGFSPAHELVAPQGAVVERAGEQRNYDTNLIDDLIPGLELELLPELFPLADDAFGEPSEQPVEVALRVTRDIEPARRAILRFVEAYNQSVKTFNEELLYPGRLEGDRSLAAARARLIRAVEEPIPGEEPEAEVRSVEAIGLEVRHGRQSGVSELTLRRLALFDVFGQPPSPLAAATGPMSIIEGLGRIGIRQTDDGTLRVDHARLERSLREEPALVGEILRDRQQSVLPRVQEQLGRIRDVETGILARRRRLFEHLGETGLGAAFARGAAARRGNLDVLMETTASQLDELQGFLGKL